MAANPSPIATELSAVVHARGTRATGLPGRELWSYRAPPAQSARPARGARGGTGWGGPVHHRRSPSHGAPDHATHRASPHTAPAACDSAPLWARGMLGVVARRVSTPRAGTSESRARHGPGGRHT